MHNPRIFHIKSIDKKCKWLDNDHVMLHACFELLVDCVENDNLFNDFWTPIMENGKIIGKADICVDPLYLEFKELYDWWKGYLNGDITYKNNTEAYEKENEMLIRLIKIRKRLWT